MKRILILGSAGAGKTVLARQLGARLDLPIIHLDRHFWLPGWQCVSGNSWPDIVQELTLGECWIIDGNYRSTLDMRLDACDTAIFLDFPRTLCLAHAFKRLVQYRNRSRADIGPGCQERLDWNFVKWIWSFPERSRPEMLAKLDRARSRKHVIILKSPAAVTAFLQSLNRTDA